MENGNKKKVFVGSNFLRRSEVERLANRKYRKYYFLEQAIDLLDCTNKQFRQTCKHRMTTYENYVYTFWGLVSQFELEGQTSESLQQSGRPPPVALVWSLEHGVGFRRRVF